MKERDQIVQLITFVPTVTQRVSSEYNLKPHLMGFLNCLYSLHRETSHFIYLADVRKRLNITVVAAYKQVKELRRMGLIGVTRIGHKNTYQLLPQGEYLVRDFVMHLNRSVNTSKESPKSIVTLYAEGEHGA